MGNIYLQLYSFMDGGKYDTRNNLKCAAEMGYDGVELFGPNFDIPVAEMKRLLQDNQLIPISLHASTDQVLELLPYAKGLAMDYIGIGMETMADEAAVHSFCERLNNIGKACKAEGITLVYHNHTQEFGACGNQIIIEVLMERTNPQYVSFELDAGWCAAAGYDPIAFVKKHSGRVRLIHIKESSEVIGVQSYLDFGNLPRDERGFPIFTPELKATMERSQKINCPAGKGIVDWQALKEAADRNGCQGYIVEREYTYSGSRRECLKADLDYYRTVI